jgi:hypothetical protein
MDLATQGPEDLALQALGPLMAEMDRSDAIGEAAFAAMETVVFLMRAMDGPRGPERLELLRQALASARATVVAAGYALTTAADAERRSH